MSQLDARREAFETAAALADALSDPAARWSWDSLRELLLAAFIDGGLATADSVRRAADELASAALEESPRPHLRRMPSRP
jgi:hypothetical protein